MFSEVRIKVSGKVQGVGYRDFATTLAKELGIVGWIRNNGDGTVETLAQGEPDTLKTYTAQLNIGPALAQIDSVTADWGSITKQYDDFEVWK